MAQHQMLVFGFNRPEMIERRLDEVLRIAPPNVFVSIDYKDDVKSKEKIDKLTTLGEAGNRQARLARAQRPAPGIGAGRFAHDTPFEFLVASIL